MTLRDTPPFRADHVGSLLRPERLLRARAGAAEGSLSKEKLREVEDEAIREVVGAQRDVGLRSVTDGEFRRTSWHMDFIYRLGGIAQSDDKIKVQFHNADGTIEFETSALAVTAPVTLPETIFADHFRFLQSVAAPDQPPKLTIRSPSMVHYRGGPAAIDP